MAKNNIFGKNPLDTTKENADPLNLAKTEVINIQELRKNPPVLPAVTIAPVDPQFLADLEHFRSCCPAGSTIQFVPAGSEGLVIRMEFNPEINTRIEQLEIELTGIGGITSQETAEKANATLKKAKTLETALKSERLLMASPLAEKQTDLINYERSKIGKLSNLIKTVNDAIVAFQAAENIRIAALNKKIEDEKKQAINSANDEIARKAKIKGLILEFEGNCIKNCAASNLMDIDSKISLLNKFTFDVAVYQEFTTEAYEMYKKMVVMFAERKKILQEIFGAEQAGKDTEELKKQADEHTSSLSALLDEKTETIQEAAHEESQNAASNIQMTAELKSATIVPKQKGIMKNWTFDEETIDMKLLPEEFKIYDKVRIKNAIKSGRHTIPGVNIYQKISNVTR